MTNAVFVAGLTIELLLVLAAGTVAPRIMTICMDMTSEVYLGPFAHLVQQGNRCPVGMIVMCSCGLALALWKRRNFKQRLLTCGLIVIAVTYLDLLSALSCQCMFVTTNYGTHDTCSTIWNR